MSQDPVLKIYLKYFPSPKTFSQIWCLGKKYPSLSKDCQSAVHILSQLFAHRYLKPCFKCGRIIKSISEHLVFECPHNEISRQKFWREIYIKFGFSIIRSLIIQDQISQITHLCSGLSKILSNESDQESCLVLVVKSLHDMFTIKGNHY